MEKNYDEVYEGINNRMEEVEFYRREDQSFKFFVDSYGAKLSSERKLEIINNFTFLDFKGEIKMKDPKNIFWIIEQYQLCSTGEMKADFIFFAREIALGNRDLIHKFTLKKRKYLGTTSMDSELSLLSSNQALAREGSIVYDPFVGTGSFLITSAHFGSLVIGGDIDILVLHGEKKKTNKFIFKF